MRWRTDDVLGRAEGRHLLERKGTHSDLAPAFLWLAQTICILQGSFGQFFFIRRSRTQQRSQSSRLQLRPTYAAALVDRTFLRAAKKNAQQKRSVNAARAAHCLGPRLGHSRRTSRWGTHTMRTAMACLLTHC